MDEDRILTEADVKAVVKELKKSLLQDLYTNAGKGVLVWVWRAFITLLILLALYGAGHNSDWLATAARHAGGGQ